MVRQLHRKPRDHNDGDGFDAQAWRKLGGDSGVDSATYWRDATRRTLPAPAVLDALKAFIAEHCEDCHRYLPASEFELYDAAIEAGVYGVADMVLRDFAYYALDHLGYPTCRSAGGLPPCMFATRAGKWRPPCGRIPGPDDGDGILTRHRFRYFACGGLALTPGTEATRSP